jgi:hypothetical protein
MQIYRNEKSRWNTKLTENSWLKDPSVTARPISVYRTQQSHVLSLRENLPLPIANVEYLSLGMGALSIYSQDNIKVLHITLFHRAVIFFDIRLFFKPFMLYVV